MKESCVNNCILLFISKDKSDITQLYLTFLYRTSYWQSPCSKSLMKTIVEHSTSTNSCCRVFHSSCLYFCPFFVSSDIGSLYRLFYSLGMSQKCRGSIQSCIWSSLVLSCLQWCRVFLQSFSPLVYSCFVVEQTRKTLNFLPEQDFSVPNFT